MKLCNGGKEIYGMNEHGDLKYWYCYLDHDRENMKWGGLSFPNFLLVRYEDTQGDDLIWDSRVGHNDVSEPVKRALLKTWLINCFQEELVKDPRSRSFDDYKWMFDLEINQLADEYELRIGNKGHMLDDIWENCKKVQGDNTYWWHDKKLEEDERREIGVDIEGYDPPKVHVETLNIKRFSFDSGHSFICVTKELMDALPLGKENGSRVRGDDLKGSGYGELKVKEGSSIIRV
ncbi:hypothetical protein Tco_0480681 [Tanacetum coccineum]